MPRYYVLISHHPTRLIRSAFYYLPKVELFYYSDNKYLENLSRKIMMQTSSKTRINWKPPVSLQLVDV